MITEQTVIDHIDILEDGQIQLRTSRRIFDGTERLAEQYHRQVLEPGQDVSLFPQRLRAICATVWTAQVITDYIMAKAQNQLKR